MSAFDVFQTDEMEVYRDSLAPSPDNPNVETQQRVTIAEHVRCHLSQALPEQEQMKLYLKCNTVMRLFYPADCELSEGDTVTVVKNALTDLPKRTYTLTCSAPVPNFDGMEVLLYG